MILTQSAPSLLPLTHRIRQLLQAERREVLMRLPGAVRYGTPIDLRHWQPVWYEHLRPAMSPYWQSGIAQGLRQVQAATGSKSLSRVVRKDVSTLRIPDRAFSLHNPAVLEAIDQATMTFCQETNQTATTGLNEAIEALRRELAEGIEAGSAYTDLGKLVHALFDTPRATTIANTETVRALNGGAVLMYQRSGAAEGSGWMTTSDPCDRCQALDGEERGFGEPFTIDPKGGAYAVCYHPPLHPHCVLEETPVMGASLISACHSKYQGPVVRLTFSDWSEVAVTPNHMLLTSSGFARAADLVQGDDIIRACSRPANRFPDLDDPYENRKPPLAHEVFRAASKAFGVATSRVPVAPEYLHGDAAFCHREIDVVRPNGFLRSGNQSRFLQPRQHFPFVPGFGGSGTGSLLSGECDLASVLKALLFATNGVVGSRRERSAVLWAASRKTNALSGAHAPDRQSQLVETASYDHSLQSHRLRYCENAFPGLVSTSKLIDVYVYTPAHPVSVYDFETNETMYTVGNGLVSSNCYCVSYPVV